MEIKLLNVAKTSQEELLGDYEDFLRQRNLPIWPKHDEKVQRLRHYAFRLSHLRNLSNLGHLKEKPKLPEKAVVAANLMVTLGHQVTYLLSHQVEAAEESFLDDGGYTENLFKRRISRRITKKDKKSQLL